MILDTSFIIDFMVGDVKAVEKMELLLRSKEHIFVTAPTVFELWSGVERCKKPELEKKKILAVLESQLFLELDKVAAEKAGNIDGKLAIEGQQIDSEDCLIAGIAICNHEKILTRNVKHFSRIKGLHIETY